MLHNLVFSDDRWKRQRSITFTKMIRPSRRLIGLSTVFSHCFSTPNTGFLPVKFCLVESWWVCSDPQVSRLVCFRNVSFQRSGS